VTDQPSAHQQGIDIRLERDTMRLERTVTDMRVEVAAGLAGINTRLDGLKDHEPRLRALEQSISNQVTRNDVEEMLVKAIEASRRPAWRDVGALIIAISTASGLVLTASKLIQ
jgi:hypothetical protein